MKKCKNVFGTIFGFTIGTIIASITATYAATTLSSKNVYYDNSNSGGSSTNVAGAIDELYATADDQDILKKEIIDTIYPVGSVYITTTESQVSDVVARFGGTWERYATDTTLVGYKEGTNTINATGGAKAVTLATTNLPSHSHVVPSLSGYTTPTTHTFGVGGTGQYSVTPGGTTDSMVLGTKNYSVGASQYIEIPSLTVTTNASNTTTCTNCSSTPINVQDPYTVVYMYKRTS